MWECGQRDVWVVIRVQTWGPVVSGRTTTNWEENHHSDPFASQTSRWRPSKWRPGRWRPGKWQPSRWRPSIWRVGRWRVQQTRQLWLTQQLWQVRRIVYDSAVVADPAQYQEVPTQHTHRFQSSAVVPWRLVEELRVPASGPFHREDGTVRGFTCSGSRAQGPSEHLENHQTGGLDGWVISHVRPETPWFQVQQENDIILEDYVKDISLRLSGISYCHHDPENSDTGAALSCWRWQGSPPPTLFWQSGKFSAASSTKQHWRVPGGGLADFAPHWLSLLGNCRATGIVEDGVGSAFQQRHQLTHQCVSFRTRNSRQDLQQALDVLLLKGSIERVTNMTSLGYYNRLFLVPKKTGDLRLVILSQPPHDSATLQDGDARVRPFSHQKWTISIDIRDAYLMFRCTRLSAGIYALWSISKCTSSLVSPLG